MTEEHDAVPLRCLPCQILDTSSGVIIKRGITEVKISGDGALDCLHFLLRVLTKVAHTKQQLCELFAAPNRSAVSQLIEHLQKRRIIVPDGSPLIPDYFPETSIDIFHWEFGQTTRSVNSRLDDRRFILLGINEISRELARILTSSGVQRFEVVDDHRLRNHHMFDEQGNLIEKVWSISKPPIYGLDLPDSSWLKRDDCLVVTSDYGDNAAFLELNDFCVRQKQHFFPAYLHNLVGYVGPWVIPDETACFQCFRARVNANSPNFLIEDALKNTSHNMQSVSGFHPAMAAIVGNVAAFELIRAYSGVLPMKTAGTFLEINLLSMRFTSRKVLKLPRCTVCSVLNRKSCVSARRSEFTPLHKLPQ
jgi:bacteriocin biosynthesis cyclodehydratase domain-containing protein